MYSTRAGNCDTTSVQATPVISVRSEDPVQPVVGGSEFQSSD
jgi:hypothetical protein